MILSLIMAPRPNGPNKQDKPEGAQDLTKESFQASPDTEALRAKVADAVFILLQPGHLELLSPEKRAALTSALVRPAAGTQTGLTVGSSTAPIRTDENLARRDELVRALGDVPDIEAARATLRKLKVVLAERGESPLCPTCMHRSPTKERPSGVTVVRSGTLADGQPSFQFRFVHSGRDDLGRSQSVVCWKGRKLSEHLDFRPRQPRQTKKL